MKAARKTPLAAWPNDLVSCVPVECSVSAAGNVGTWDSARGMVLATSVTDKDTATSLKYCMVLPPLSCVR